MSTEKSTHTRTITYYLFGFIRLWTMTDKSKSDHSHSHLVGNASKGQHGHD